jgi:chromate transporter
VVSKIFMVYKNHTWLRNAMAGIKPVVVGLILASAYKLLHSLPLNLSVIIICLLTLGISLKYKMSPVYLILASLIAGACLTFLNYSI